MRIDFDADKARPYAERRFCEMSGMDASARESVTAYRMIEPQINIRASVGVFREAIKNGGIDIGSFIACPPLTETDGGVYAYALTVGELSYGGETLSDTLADIWGTAFVDAGLSLLRDKIAADNPGKIVSRPFGPGFFGISIDAVETIFNALNCAEADIGLRDGLLYPIKSSIGFFLVTDVETRLPSRDCADCSGDTSCEYCRNRSVSVTFKNENKTVSVPAGATAAEAARRAGITVETPCGGMGICGKCEGIVESNGDTKIAKLCIERLYDDTTVYTKINGDTKIGDTKTEVHITNAVKRGGYFLAVDLGTTTIEAALSDGENVIARAARINPQAAYAADVIGRIRLASEGAAMTRLAADAVNDIINQICAAVKIVPEAVEQCVIAGNTAMQCIAAGISPESLGRYPYDVPDQFGREIPASELGIGLSCGVFFPPVISAFVGGDVVCGIVRTRLWERGKTLLLDIGTNGEMAYMKDGRLIVSSAAAGPAFEGMGIRFGMRAESGAVSRFKIMNRNTVAVETIDKAPAVGICGSGLLEIISELVKHGIIAEDGSFCDKGLITSPLRNRLCGYDGETAFRICSGVYITQSDVRAVQLAKGAVRAAVETAAPDAERVMIAGTLGKSAGESGLIGAGILPERFAGKTEFVGNTSLRGAIMLTNDVEARGRTREIAMNAHTVSLSENAEFENLFIKHMNFIK